MPIPLAMIPTAVKAGTALAGIGAQAGMQAHMGRKGHERQKELMGIQYQNQQGLNQQGHELQMEMWNKTNFPEQVAKLKEAGLNPALLYGKQGAGGVTTGSQTGGSAQGGNYSHAPMMDIAGMMKLASEIGLIDAQKDKTEEETKKIGGVDTELAWAQTNYTERLGLKTEVETELARLQKALTVENTRKIAEETKGIIIANDIQGQAKADIIKNIKLDAILKEVQAKLGEANIKLTDQKVEESKQIIAKYVQEITNMEEMLKVQQDMYGKDGWKKKVDQKANDIKEAYNKIIKDLGNAGITQGYVKLGAESLLKIGEMVTDVLNPIKGFTKAFGYNSKGQKTSESHQINR